MVNHLEAQLEQLSIHYIGEKLEEEGIQSTSKSIEIVDSSIETLLMSYFFDNYKEPEFFNFTYLQEDIVMNPMYNIANNIFNDPSCLHEQSVLIAQHLYEKSGIPDAKRGELLVAYVDNILVDDEMIDGIVIIKSENRENFLQLDNPEGEYQFSSMMGINPKKLEKGCIILNTESEQGYKLCVKDKIPFGRGVKYWSDDFLYIKPRPDNYQQTKTQINMTKSFIKERLQPLHEIEKTEEAAILHRSQKFFKNNDSFEAENYEEKVFQDERTISEFKAYKEDYANERNVEVKDDFEISDEAVKKQARLFKSVLKLDKNFHIYIHGDRKMIQKGTDDSGRKFYQVFYEEEN